MKKTHWIKLSTPALCLNQIIIVMIICSPLRGYESAGCIEGIIRYRNYVCNEVEIYLEDTDFHTLTDSSGYFFLENINPGVYNLFSPAMQWSDLSSDGRSVSVVAGDTTIANVICTSMMVGAENYSYSLERDIWWEPVELHFKLDVPPQRSCDGFYIFADYSICPVERVDEDEYVVEVPPHYGEFTWSLPWLGERELYLRDCRTTRESTIILETVEGLTPAWTTNSMLLNPLEEQIFPLAKADVTIDEWSSPELNVEHTIIDPRLWGDQQLRMSGLKTHLMTFRNDETESWLLTMFFHDGYVVLEENGSATFEPLEFTVRSARISLNGKYALLNIAQRDDSQQSPYIVINMETGEIRGFDPFPGMNYEEEGDYFGPASGSTVIVRPVRDFRMSNTGCILGHFDAEIRTYDDTGELIQEIYVKDYVGSDYPQVHFVATKDGLHWSALMNSLNHEPVLLLGGVFDFAIYDELDPSALDRSTRMQLSDNNSYLSLSNRYGSFRILDLRTGVLSPFPFSGSCIVHPLFSPDGKKITSALFEDGLPVGEYCCFIGNTDKMAEEGVSFPGFSLHWFTALPVAINNNGWILVRFEERTAYNPRYRYTIFDQVGELVWMSHYIIGKPNATSEPFPMFEVSSQHLNRFAYCDRELVHILTFTQEGI